MPRWLVHRQTLLEPVWPSFMAAALALNLLALRGTDYGIAVGDCGPFLTVRFLIWQ